MGEGTQAQERASTAQKRKKNDEHTENPTHEKIANGAHGAPNRRQQGKNRSHEGTGKITQRTLAGKKRRTHRAPGAREDSTRSTLPTAKIIAPLPTSRKQRKGRTEHSSEEKRGARTAHRG